MSWGVLREWLRTEEPTNGGPDLLGHTAIAERIVQTILGPGNHSIALIGAVGSGKTSIVNFVTRDLAVRGAPIVVADFNCWAMPKPDDVPRIALERVIEALSRIVDVQSIRNMPTSYQRILAAEPSGKVSRLLGLDEVVEPTEQLQKLSPLLETVGVRLLLVIEDAERAGRAFEARSLERLLWTLRRVKGVSFILSFDSAKADFDYPKLCDVIERIPQIGVERVEEILGPAYRHWSKFGDGYIDPMAEPRQRDNLGLYAENDEMVRYVRRLHGGSVADSIAALLTSPRNLKHFVRDVERSWSALRGEIELNDLIVVTALRHGAPRAFDFIVKNVEAARSSAKPDATFTGQAEKTVKPRWLELRKTLDHPDEVQTLVDVLGLHQLVADRLSPKPAPQGIRNDEPVDYLGRLLAGRLTPTDVPDQVVLRDITNWKSNRSGSMLARLAEAKEDKDQYARVWEHYATHLTDDELIEVATSLIDHYRETLGANASMREPALLALWRKSGRRFRDTRTDWLISQIASVLPTSLGFATDLFQFWASVPHGIVSEEHRARARKALVEKARATFTTPDSLLLALGVAHKYALTRLVHPPPTDEPPDPIPTDSWAWLVDLILAAGVLDQNQIVPDVAVMIGDTAYGVRSGNFEERYRIVPERLDAIFGDRALEVLELLSRYEGKDEYAIHARQNAGQMISERGKGASGDSRR